MRQELLFACSRSRSRNICLPASGLPAMPAPCQAQPGGCSAFPRHFQNFRGPNNSPPLNFSRFSVPRVFQKLTRAVHVVAQNHKWWYLALASNLNLKNKVQTRVVSCPCPPQFPYICREWGSLGDVRRSKGRVVPQGISYLFFLLHPETLASRLTRSCKQLHSEHSPQTKHRNYGNGLGQSVSSMLHIFISNKTFRCLFKLQNIQDLEWT